MEFIELHIPILILIIISSVVILSSYIRIPYQIALLIVGLIVGFLDILPPINLSPELIFNILLPVIIFEGSIKMPIRHLMDRIKSILLIAFGGTTLEFTLFAIMFSIATGIDWQYSLLLGVAICATDPASILSMFKGLGIERRLSILIEGESIIDDGIAIVAFQVIIALILTGTFSVSDLILRFLRITVGGAILGFIIGYLFSHLFRKIRNHFVELITTTILVYGVTLLAHYLGQSGIIAVLTAGLVVSNYGFPSRELRSSRETIITFWEFAAFIVTSLIFLLIGLEIPRIGLINLLPLGAIAFLFTIIARFFMIHTVASIPSLWKDTIPLKHRHILFWGGLRGVVALALMLSIPATFHIKSQFIGIAFIVVFCSLITQGITINPLANLLNLTKIPKHKEEYKQYLAHIGMINEALRELERLYREGSIIKGDYMTLKREYQKELRDVEKNVDILQNQYPSFKEEKLLELKEQLIKKEKETIQEELREGRISRSAFNNLNYILNKRLEDIELSKAHNNLRSSKGEVENEKKENGEKSRDNIFIRIIKKLKLFNKKTTNKNK